MAILEAILRLITIFIILSPILYLRFTTANVKLSAGQHFSWDVNCDVNWVKNTNWHNQMLSSVFIPVLRTVLSFLSSDPMSLFLAVCYIQCYIYNAVVTAASVTMMLEWRCYHVLLFVSVHTVNWQSQWCHAFGKHFSFSNRLPRSLECTVKSSSFQLTHTITLTSNLRTNKDMCAVFLERNV